MIRVTKISDKYLEKVLEARRQHYTHNSGQLTGRSIAVNLLDEKKIMLLTSEL